MNNISLSIPSADLLLSALNFRGGSALAPIVRTCLDYARRYDLGGVYLNVAPSNGTYIVESVERFVEFLGADGAVFAPCIFEIRREVLALG